MAVCKRFVVGVGCSLTTSSTRPRRVRRARCSPSPLQTEYHTARNLISTHESTSPFSTITLCCPRSCRSETLLLKQRLPQLSIPMQSHYGSRPRLSSQRKHRKPLLLQFAASRLSECAGPITAPISSSGQLLMDTGYIILYGLEQSEFFPDESKRSRQLKTSERSTRAIGTVTLAADLMKGGEQCYPKETIGAVQT